MERTPASEGGWEAAVDASLVARLVRPAIRPGISDPAHGRTLAARLQRMTAPSLADDVAGRYGSAALDGNRPPVVHATPLPPSAAPDALPPAPGAVARPVVRATAIDPGPRIPPLRPAGPGASVQRSAAAMPIVTARRAITESREREIGRSADPGAREISIPTRPVVAPAPTRLQRMLAPEHAETVSMIDPPRPIAVPRRGAGSENSAVIGRAIPDSSARSGASAPGSAAAGIVQRLPAPADPHPDLEIGSRARWREGSISPMTTARDGGATTGADAREAVRSQALPPASPPATSGSGSAARPVVMARGVGAVQRAADRSAGSLPVAGAMGVVQRAAIPGGAGSGGGAPRLVHVAPAPAAAVVKRTEASPAMTEGGPRAELPTVTAEGAGSADGGAEGVAERVYEILVRRLVNERKQRGW